jgi:hypothetical protein
MDTDAIIVLLLSAISVLIACHVAQMQAAVALILIGRRRGSKRGRDEPKYEETRQYKARLDAIHNALIQQQWLGNSPTFNDVDLIEEQNASSKGEGGASEQSESRVQE